jgi:hypothetical protein
VIRRATILRTVAVLALAAGACGSDPTASPPAGHDSATASVAGPTSPPSTQLSRPDPPAPPRGDGDLLAGYLDELTVAAHDPARPAYDRESWEEGLDTDGDCLRTRHEVLTDESIQPVRIADCKVVAGSWIDPLTATATTDPADLEVDHLVALADAHRSGGWRWDPDRKAAFANALADPGHLNAVSSAENQRKADDGPESYRPPDPSAWCWYATAYARVKATWELTVTPDQMAGLRALASSCR